MCLLLGDGLKIAKYFIMTMGTVIAAICACNQNLFVFLWILNKNIFEINN